MFAICSKMMKTQFVPSITESKMSEIIDPSISIDVSLDQHTNYIQLPEDIIRKIAGYVSPIDRLRLQLVCKRFKTLLSQWPDICTLEIRPEKNDKVEQPQSTTVSRFNFNSKVPQVKLNVKLIDNEGRACNLRNEQVSVHMLKLLFSRLPNLIHLIVFDSCLVPEFASLIYNISSIKQLKLWNCSKYFEKKVKNKKVVHALLGLPALEELLVLETNTGISSYLCTAIFDKSCARKIRSTTIKNLQLTGLHLPLSSFQILVDKLSTSCTRLAIGCTYGKFEKRLDYLKTMMQMKSLSDLDMPPFLFYLNDLPVADGMVEKLFDILPLKALGFRHYNSAILFQFIENRLPLKIRVLRVHHNANRIPNFASLGTEPEEVVVKKSSVISHYSILSASRSSISSYNATNDAARAAVQMSSSDSSGSGTKDSKIASNLASRRLTIFALAEDSKSTRNRKLRQKSYFGVDVFYIQEMPATQEIFGRMGSPMKSPHVYSKSLKKDSTKARVIKGDIVRLIPIAALGLEESDYDLSDFED